MGFARPDHHQLVRGKEMYDRLEWVFKGPTERMIWWIIMFSIEKEHSRNQGQHSGWATAQDCTTAVNSMTTQLGYPTCSTAEIKEMTRNCVYLGLLEVKNCDTRNGLQHYLKTSSIFQDYKAYKKSIPCEDFQDGTAQRWWTKNSKGEYHPKGPTQKSREQFKPIIESVVKGSQVDRCYRMEGCIGQLGWTPLMRVMLVVRGTEAKRKDRGRNGVHIDQIAQILADYARDNGKPILTRSEVQTIVQAAIRSGFLSAIPSDSDEPLTRVAITEVFLDLMLYVSGSISFSSMLNTARGDNRFYDLFKKIEAGMA